jgi:UDP-N-acetyl-D-mannosaminuronate dehydrogenase
MEIFRDADCIVLITDHDAFRSFKLDDMKKLAKDGCAIVDGRGFFEKEEVKTAGFEYLGVGRGE